MVDQTLTLCLGTFNREFRLTNLNFEIGPQALWVENVGASGQWEEIFSGHHDFKANAAF